MAKSMPWNTEDFVSMGLKPYEHQVGGHRFEEGKKGLLQCCQGHILKPLPQSIRGDCERQFYNKVFFSNDPDYEDIKPFLPCCLGFKELVLSPHSEQENYIILENVTENYNKPSILDIKIGKNTSDKFASQEKRKRECNKYSLQEELGFRIIGIKLFNKISREYTFYDRYYGRSLSTHDSVLEVLKSFFHDGEKRRSEVLELVIKKLEKIEHWFTKQTKVDAISSSILIVYDTEQGQKDNNNLSDTNGECSCSGERRTMQAARDRGSANLAVERSNSPCLCFWNENIHTNGMLCQDQDDLKNDKIIERTTHAQEDLVMIVKCDVRMIDFAHIYEQDGIPRVDENYLYGIRTLISLLKKC